MQQPSTNFTLTIEPDADGERLDRALAASLGDLSRSRIQALIKDGHVRLGAALVVEPARRVKSGEVVKVEIPAPAPLDLQAEELPLDISYEDEHLLVLHKKAGQVVHPAPGHDSGTLVHALLAHCGESLSGIGGVQRPGIVHRLDKDVSGLLMVAKNDHAHRSLAGQLSVHSVERAYEAIVHGVPAPASGRIEKAIARHPKDRKRMAIVEQGKHAITDYRLLAAENSRIARVELRLHTGRTHQIRVHLTSINHPILGDPIYRPKRKPNFPNELQQAVAAMNRVALHARTLGFDHPVSGERLRFESPAPAIFDKLLQLARL